MKRLLYYLFLECRVTLKNIYQELQWMAPSLSKAYVSAVFYLVIMSESLWSYMRSMRMLI